MIIKNTVKQRPLCLYLQNQNFRLNMGLTSLEGGLNKIRYTDVFLYKEYFWLFSEIISLLLTRFGFYNQSIKSSMTSICCDFNHWGCKCEFHWYLNWYLMWILWTSLQMLVSQYFKGKGPKFLRSAHYVRFSWFKNLSQVKSSLFAITLQLKVQMKWFFLLLNLKEQQKSGRSPFTVS